VTTQPLGSRLPPEEALALAHAEQQAAMRAVALEQVLQVWQSAPTSVEALFGWWFGGARDEIYTLTSIGQELMASEARDYVRDSMALQGYEVDIPMLDPAMFAGVASDGDDLDGLLDNVAFRAWRAEVVDAKEQAQARAEAEYLLRRIVFQQTTDAGREADQVAIVAADLIRELTREEVETYVPVSAMPPLDTRVLAPPPAPNRAERDRRLAERKRANGTPIGWIRVLTPPSCGRCAILAGKWYGWNEGFARHDNCDCRHVPALEADSGDIVTDPRAYFESLSTEDQDRFFGRANAQAIRDGADVSQVVNSTTAGVYTADGRQYTTAGTTRRGSYGRSGTGRSRVKRMTPLQIYREAGVDREEARRLLSRFGYLVE
jgi:hypothetical protein